MNYKNIRPTGQLLAPQLLTATEKISNVQICGFFPSLYRKISWAHQKAGMMFLNCSSFRTQKADGEPAPASLYFSASNDACHSYLRLLHYENSWKNHYWMYFCHPTQTDEEGEGATQSKAKEGESWKEAEKRIKGMWYIVCALRMKKRSRQRPTEEVVGETIMAQLKMDCK